MRWTKNTTCFPQTHGFSSALSQCFATVTFRFWPCNPPPQQICFQLHAAQLQNTWDHQRGYQIYLLKLCDHFWVTLEFSEKMTDNTAQSADTEAMI